MLSEGIISRTIRPIGDGCWGGHSVSICQPLGGNPRMAVLRTALLERLWPFGGYPLLATHVTLVY